MMSVRRRGTDGLEDGEMDHLNDAQTAREPSNTKGDEKNIAILFFLYLLQGIPLGLSAAIPMYLQNRGVSYRQQLANALVVLSSTAEDGEIEARISAEFSLVHWPFSMKLLWAPIVDSVYSPSFGRRKSWLIPTQYLIGLFMLYLSGNVEGWLGGGDVAPNIGVLTFCFFGLSFLAATQDIAVDGWALTMLKRCNVGHASTCNSVGQTAGYFLGYVVFVGLESAEFCNTYLRSTPADTGIITLPGDTNLKDITRHSDEFLEIDEWIESFRFLYFWGVVFLATTTLVALFKTERPCDHPSHPEQEMGIMQTYHLLWKIIQLPSIRTTVLILLTCKIGFSACDSVSSLKLIDAGVPKEKLALLLFGLVAAFLVWVTPFLITGGIVPLYYYVLLIVSYAFHQVTLYCMFVAVMAFFARVSDPAVGGTYMTLLNTLSNLGGNWPSTLALWLVDSFTYRTCSVASVDNDCSSAEETQACVEAGGTCNISLDGFYIESLFCFIFGWLWLSWGRNKVKELQRKPDKDWQVVKRRNSR
uniref:Acetyl-coenzyme A transporter 1 n=1 Tax=Timema shepardi TaxID=629360 RepID=A0A7R9FXY2_TIMSH|nr:unnamed protein product [Timema shepardi]